MVLPAGVTTCLVYKKAPVSFGGGQGAVEVEITPSVKLIHIESGTELVNFFESVTPAEGGIAQMVLPHTDQPGFKDEAGNAFINWHYTARVKLKKSGQKQKDAPLFDFQLPSGQTEVDLSDIASGVAALPTSAPIAVVTSINGQTGAADTFEQLARTPEILIVGAITRDAGGAPTSAAVAWPDGTAGVFTGTPSAMYPGSLDSYTITYGTTRTYTQPAVTRDTNGTITTQPAIVLR